MKVNRRQLITIEMEVSDFYALRDILDEASNVRSRIYPLLNKRAADILECIRKAEGGNDAPNE